MTFLNAFLLFALFRIFYNLCVGFLYKKNSTDYLFYNPLVSVIIPAWNEGVGIKKTVNSIMRNGYENLEVIIINDGSKDNTLKIAKALKKSYWEQGTKIKIFSQVNKGKAMALNKGISKAKGEIILTIDADSFITPGTIRKLVNPFANNECDVTIGQILVGNTKSLLGLIQHFEYTFGFHNKKAQNILNSIFIFPGALSAFRKKKIKEAKCFENYSCTEDLDLSMKIRENGNKVVYVSDAICITEGASDLKGLSNQRLMWRHGFLQCILNRKKFITNTKKGWYLTLIEFPLSLLGLVEILFFPITYIYLFTQILQTADPIITIFSFLLLPYAYFLTKSNLIKLKPIELLAVFFIPIFFTFINILEFFVLIKAIYRTVTNTHTAWTVWNRQGI